MTAPVRIEASDWGELKYATLARLMGFADADHALVKVARIRAWQTEHYTPEAPTYVVDPDIVESALGTGGAAALVRAKLAEEHPDGLHILESEGRIEWLWQRRQASAKGGEATARKARAASKPAPAPQPSRPASVGEPPDNIRPSGPGPGQPEPEPGPGPKPSLLILLPEEELSPPRAIPPTTGYRAQGPLTAEEIAQHREIGRLAEGMWVRVNASRIAIAAELGLTGIIALPVLSPVHQPTSFRELLARIREEGRAARQVCDHVHDVLCAQARRDGDVEWLGEKAFLPGSWREARNGSPDSSLPRGRAGPKGSAVRAPEPTPARKLTTLKPSP